MLRYGWEIYQFLLKGFAKANKRFPNPKEIKFIENTALRIRNKLMESGVDLEKLDAEDAVKLYANPPKLPAKPKSKPAGIEAIPLQDPKLREQALKKKLEAQNLQAKESLQTMNKPTSVMVYDKNHKPGMAGMEVELKKKPTIDDLMTSGEITKGTAPKTNLTKIRKRIIMDRQNLLDLAKNEQIPVKDIEDFLSGKTLRVKRGPGRGIIQRDKEGNPYITETFSDKYKDLPDDDMFANGGRVGFKKGGNYWLMVQEAYDAAGGEEQTGLSLFDFANKYFPKMADGGRVGLMAGGILKGKKILDLAKKAKKGKGKFTASEAIIARLKNTIKNVNKMGMDPSEVEYVKKTFPNFIKELKKNPKLAENENVWNQLMSDLPPNQRFIKYDDGTVDFQMKKPSHTFKLREDLDTDRKGPIAPKEEKGMFDNVFDKMFSEYEYDQYIKSGRKPNADGGLATLFGEK